MGVGVALGVAVAVGVAVSVRVGVAVSVTVGVSVAVRVAVAVPLAVAVAVAFEAGRGAVAVERAHTSVGRSGTGVGPVFRQPTTTKTAIIPVTIKG